MKKDITELFCNVDDFCREIDAVEKLTKIGSKRRPTRMPQMEKSEIITIILLYHMSPCKNFKFFFTNYLQLYRSDFPKLVSYNRFIELMSRVFSYTNLRSKSR